MSFLNKTMAENGSMLYCLEAFISFTPHTDYLNNLSPDSKEYEDTQGTVNM